MRRMPAPENKAVIRSAIFFAALTGFGAPVAEGAEPRIAIDWNLSPTDKVGSHKSGMACFPSGSLRWQEIAKPDAALLGNLLESLLEPSSAEPEVSGKLVSLKASLCTPWLGVGEAQPKSEIKIFVRWTFRNAGGTSFDRVVETEIARKQYDLRRDPALLSDAIEANFRDAISQNR